MPIAVRDLRSAEATYRDVLGFSVKPGRPHGNSLDNVHLKFRDGSELELITATRPDDELAAWYLRFLQDGDGGAFAALDGGPIDGLAARVERLGHAPRRSRGRAFDTLSFPPGGPLRHLFFSHLHHPPRDRPRHLQHANTARGLHAVWLAGDRFEAELELLTVLGCGPPEPFELPHPPLAGRQVELARGRLYLLPRRPGQPAGRRVVGATVLVEDLSRALGALGEAAEPSPVVRVPDRGRSVVIAPRVAHGMWIEFLEPEPER